MTTNKGGSSSGKAAAAPRHPKRSGKITRDWNADPDPGYQPPRQTVPPAAEPSIPPKNAKLLPLHETGSRRFEELCLELMEVAYPEIVRSSSLKRVGGVAQYGVDCEGFDADHEPAVLVSCKCYRDVNAWDIRLWVDEFMRELDDHWSGRKIRIFVLAVTHEFNDDRLNDATRKLVAGLKARGIAFELWNANRITSLVSKDANRVGRYFHEAWVDVLARNVGQSVDTVAGKTPFATSDAMRLMEQAFNQFAAGGTRQLGPALGGRLEEAVAAARRGKTSPLLEWYDETRADDTSWRTLTPETQAIALRAVAVLRIQTGETGQSEALLDEADTLMPPADPVERALLERSRRSPEHALAFLQAPSTVRGKELKIALLVEAGRAGEARTIAAAIPGTEVTAEILRLRAIIACLAGDRQTALREARSSVERAPHDFLPRLTRGVIRLNAALAEDVVPQFGHMPQPINVGLVRDDPAARMLLEGAASDFEHVSAAVDAPTRRDAEVWHLAALLLHPDRLDEGNLFARRLLSRERPEPLVVAWAAHRNVLRRSGRIKKRLGDIVRSGAGTPTDLVVLAMLAAGGRHPERGAKVIRRYQDRYPNAADLLNGWRIQLGDTEVGVEDRYAVALRAAYHDGNDGPLVDHLLGPDVAIENVLSGAEFLASRSAWSGVDRLRAALLRIGTRRTVELAVLASLHAGRPEECLGILRDIEQSSGEVGLPPSLIHMRIRANAELGRHRPVIADLQKIRRGDTDHAVGLRLLDTYILIGAHDELRGEAERAMATGPLDPERALRVANALRSHAPNVARRALTAATVDEIRPDLVGPALSLAAYLGDEATRSRMTQAGKRTLRRCQRHEIGRHDARLGIAVAVLPGQRSLTIAKSRRYEHNQIDASNCSSSSLTYID